MDLVEKLLSVPQRENAGGRTSNRYSYQQVWAFNHILELLKREKDFVLFMELHDDVIVLDSLSNPSGIDFYQIKTNNKPDRYITTSFITSEGKKYPKKMSIAQKMIDNYKKFKSNTKSIHLISNKNFDFGELKDIEKTKSTEFLTVNLSKINDTQFNKLKQGMCQPCHLLGKCKSECKTLIYFDVSTLDLINYQDTVMSKFIDHLENIEINTTITSAKAFYNTILGEIKRINNHEYKSGTIEELVKQKSISKTLFNNLIDKLLREGSNDKWKDIQGYLLADGISTILVNKIAVQWKKYQIDSMNIENIELQKIKSDIQRIILEKDYDNAKEYLDYVYSKIKYRDDIRIFSREYIYAMIVKELYIDE
ncbi:dsDNA nuclease domain-containing protein [Clostridium botulinum]|uniref:dsDNA nuclease domain-containing protein n=1 Tax=Clostridium botulinum TaxID=1491 RepID=UPI0007735F55|nr:dsDNA nuclease domain-containing protein [Clostridium botulinum]OPD20657.1 hypothetical protein AL398_13455 [Clostridium botulinum]